VAVRLWPPAPGPGGLRLWRGAALEGERMTLRVISYGGGVQSTALLILAGQGKIDFPQAVMANVGDDSEHPDTLFYVRNVAFPRAAHMPHPVGVHLVDRKRRNGETETLWGRLMREGSRSLPIPVRMNDTGAPGTRSCTADFKIRVLTKWCRDHGASKKDPALVAIGISRDEWHRARTDSGTPYQTLTYPLLDLRLNRDDCKQVIADAGWPMPSKSSCFFCPFHRLQAWVDLKRNHPGLFDKSAHLEETMNRRRVKLGKDPVWLTRQRKPLPIVVAEAMTQGELLEGTEEQHSCGPFVCSYTEGGEVTP
jgi:hypothetical protein